MNIWRKQYTLRRYNGQTYVNGYPVASYTERTTLLDVQPDMNAATIDIDGKRRVQRLTSYGDDPIITASVETGQRADRLFFEGEWFECDSSMWYEHTPIAHYTATWIRVPEGVIKGSAEVPEPAPEPDPDPDPEPVEENDESK